MTSEQLLKIITNKPGIDSVYFNLEIIKMSHPKEITDIEVIEMLTKLEETHQIKRLQVMSDTFSKSYYFPFNVRFHFS